MRTSSTCVASLVVLIASCIPCSLEFNAPMLLLLLEICSVLLLFALNHITNEKGGGLLTTSTWHKVSILAEQSFRNQHWCKLTCSCLPRTHTHTHTHTPAHPPGALFCWGRHLGVDGVTFTHSLVLAAKLGDSWCFGHCQHASNTNKASKKWQRTGEQKSQGAQLALTT